MKTIKTTLLLLAALALPAVVSAEITNGWLPTTKGTYDFLDAANWASGETNGVFSADWTSETGDIDIYLGSDWTGTFKISGWVKGRTVVRASNGPWTVTLNDDLFLTASAMNSDFVFGNGYEDKKKLNFDLGGTTRKVYMNGTTRWIFSDRISNGDLVFDGYRVRGNQGEKGDYHNIHVVYTKEHETADAYIEWLANEIGKNESVRVVTSDSLIRLSALRSGVLRTSAKEFRTEVDQINARLEQAIEDLNKT